MPSDSGGRRDADVSEVLGALHTAGGPRSQRGERRRGHGAILYGVTTWKSFAADQPDFAQRVRERFTSQKHMTLATLRRDGSPRISGTELEFTDDGELVLGMMPASLKALDLQRDPRLALHSSSVDPPDDDPSSWMGEAKVVGRGVEVPTDDGSHRFMIDITEVVLTRVGTPADHLVIESWHPGRGLQTRRRK